MSYRSFPILLFSLIIFSCDEQKVPGCMEESNCNYDSKATEEDSSCGSGEYTCGDGTSGCGCDDVCDGSAVEDCAGVCDGEATEAYCAECTSGVFNCLGLCNGPTLVDECGVCGGSGIPDGKCDCDGNALDCAGVCGGEATQEDCAACTSEVFDCLGICDGAATADDCGVCDAVTTNNNITCTKDCTGVWGGSAVDDLCGTCSGTITIEADCACDGGLVRDCAGVCGGISLEDLCLTCDDNSSNDCTQDCAGTWGGDSVEDECGVCEGNGAPENYNCDLECTADVDCSGECGGSTSDDACGTCGGEVTDTAQCACADGAVMDCNGACGGSAIEDECGVCEGNGAPENYNCDLECTAGIDCNGLCGGLAEEDECGVCNGVGPPAGYNCVGQCTAGIDCNGLCGGPAVYDECGICNGLGALENYNCAGECIAIVDCAGVCGGETTEEVCATCTSGDFDCNGLCGGPAVYDECGICGGSGPPENYNCAGKCITVTDCAGDCGGVATIDACGVCGGVATEAECAACASGFFDCSGVCDGNATMDNCGICDTNASNDCIQDCAGNWGGVATIDACGVCGGNITNPEECVSCDLLVNQANNQIFDDFQDVFEQDGTEDIEEFFDMSVSYNLYNQALSICPDNKGAHFGLAFTELVMITQDQRLSDAFDDWIECIDDLFEDDINMGDANNEMLGRSQLASQGFISGIPVSGKAFYSLDNIKILNYLPIITSYNDVMLRIHEICPEIGSIQDLIEDVFLDRMSLAISHLDAVVDRGFTYTITNEMLGDLDDEDIISVSLDDTEIYLMKSEMHQLRAMMYAVITYDVNVPYYDLTEPPNTSYNWQWLAQDSEFLSIRAGQENSWPNAHADLNNGLNSIESAWNFLKLDTDIDHDIILLEDVLDLENAMVDEIDKDINDFLDEVRKVLNEDYSVTLNFRNCSETTGSVSNIIVEECEENEIEITLNIKNFLTEPTENMKTIIPGYTITTGECEYEDDELWGCPEFSWNATTCDIWKSDWDVTIGGLFPNMTTTKFFDEIIKLDDDDCEDIINMGND